MTETPLLWTCVVGLGFGLRHALDSDHVAAITTMVAGGHSPRHAAMVGAAWGGGHAAAVLVAGAILVALGVTMPPALAATLDLAVVAMLIGLGLYAMRAPRPGSAPRAPREHSHRALSYRAALVGLVHGASGTAAIALVWLTRLPTRAHALSFLLVFALGATLSMTILSGLLAVPLGAAMRRWQSSALVLRVSSGVLSLGAAALVLVELFRQT